MASPESLPDEEGRQMTERVRTIDNVSRFRYEAKKTFDNTVLDVRVAFTQRELEVPESTLASLQIGPTKNETKGQFMQRVLERDEIKDDELTHKVMQAAIARYNLYEAEAMLTEVQA